MSLTFQTWRIMQTPRHAVGASSSAHLAHSSSHSDGTVFSSVSVQRLYEKTNIMSTWCILTFTLTHTQTCSQTKNSRVNAAYLIPFRGGGNKHIYIHIGISHIKTVSMNIFLLLSPFLTLLDRLPSLVPSKTNLLLFHFIPIYSFVCV